MGARRCVLEVHVARRRGRAAIGRADAAVMHLELLPRYVVDGRAAAISHATADSATEPAAAYTLTTLITVASYEACTGPSPAAMRYLRRDSHGGIAKNVMLRRAW